MTAQIIAAEQATVVFVESGNGIYSATLGPTSIGIARQVSTGQATVVTVTAVGNQASCELDLRLWNGDERVSIINEIADVVDTLRSELDMSPGAASILRSLAEYVARVAEQTS